MDTSDDNPRHPRITKATAKALIAMEKIIIDTDMSVVVVMVRLKNGERLVADAIVANYKTFDPERGTQIARAKIINEIIRLEMYDLRKKLHADKLKEVGNAD
jgi:hypothetical protein